MDDYKELVARASDLATGLICTNEMVAGTTMRELVEAIERLSAERDDLIGMREEVLHYQREFHRVRDELAALKSASSEPVAWMTKQGGWVRITDDPKNPDGYDIPLYTAVPEDAKDAALKQGEKK